ncbi:MBL fold metallo-hydrolase [Adhaeribacter swui]|uniref:MBL fold metallo-hydrolase n=1 Tax=Adhaeribacter swui TaxID=2086471 RepID=A0A7G7GDM2_9BACT|nr:MBL fold metallo-hydrolase [Adhaeribacter swui]QNF35256.1 MBL fold metallo-hydrolase [Adhaeribacter swui]
MQLHVINTGFFKLDGGAMFGVVPKSIWQRTNPADENNLCTWAMRCLLIEDGNQLILIDTGIGTKQDAKFLSHYYLHGEASLETSLHQAGFQFTDITDVFLTHLHFDHCGGAVQYNQNRTALELTFPKARYWSNQDHWQWATQPNAREKASFLKENIFPLQESGHLQLINPQQASPFTQFDILYVDGHTDKMMLPVIPYKGKKLVYVADLLPSVGHLPLPYVMGYDTRPLITLQEKEQFLNVVAAEPEQYVLFFEHDSVQECCTVKQTEKGVRLHEAFSLADL